MYLARFVESSGDGGAGKFPVQLSPDKFSEYELLAAEHWRAAYLAYLRSIFDETVSDAFCEKAKEAFFTGVDILEGFAADERYKKRKRVLYAVNAVCVYGEPEELGEREYILGLSKVGFAALAAKNFRF